MPSFMECEREALRIYRSQGLDPSRPIAPLKLVRLILGPDSVLRGPPGMVADGAGVRVKGRPLVFLRPDLPLERAGHVGLHEMVHLVYGTKDEAFANYLGAALVAPAPAMMRVAGFTYAEMAAAFRATQTLVALRDAEVHDRPRLIVSRSFHWKRGKWDEAPKHAGLVKTVLTDAPKRVVYDLKGVA